MKTKKHIVLIGLILLILQECLFRLFFPLPELSNFHKTNYLPKPDGKTAPRVWYEKLWYQSTPDQTPKYLHQYNGYGFRDEEWTVEKIQGRPRTLFIGDSFVEGAMAPQEGTLTSLLQQMLGSDQMEVMNMGIIGVGLDAYIALLRDALPAFRPDFVLLLLYANDAPTRPFQPSLQPFEPRYYARWQPRLLTLLGILISGDPLPYRRKQPASLMPAVPSPGNPWSTHAFRNQEHVRPDIAAAMKAGTFNPFHTNWVLKEELFLKKEIDFTPYLSVMQQLVEEHGTQLAICYLPSRHQISNYYYPFERATCMKLCPPVLDLTQEQYHRHRRHLKRVCQGLNLPYLDLAPTLREYEENDHHLYWDYDDHLREEGYEIVAKELHRQWEHLFARAPNLVE